MPSVAPEPIETDALIIGAGPVGLFQVFQLGLLGLHAEVVDALPHAGGQCVSLYADKPIYDIPGIPACTGQELTDQLLTQIRPFAPGFHFRQHVSALRHLDDGRFELHTDQGQVFLARTVFIAAGVGAFLPRSLKLPGLQALSGRQVFEGGPAAPVWPAAPHGAAIVVGQDNAALESALQAAAQGHAVTLIHRRDQFTATSVLQQALAQARAQGRVQFMAGQVVGWSGQADCLTHLQVATPEGLTQSIPADRVHICLGLVPQLGVIAQWELAMTRKQLNVNPATFETNVPGIFAVGDINSYPGKKKLILCGFHEATLAAHHAAIWLRPEQAAMPLLYTTSSPQLHRLLKVDVQGA